jgi:hypothetical protein
MNETMSHRESAAFSVRAFWWQLAPRRFETIAPRISAFFAPSLPLLGLALTLASALAGTLAVWRISADAGWASGFFIEEGLWSHWQVWFMLAICAHASASHLRRPK